jgi:hypothetical protein
MKVILDTNILVNNFYLNSPKFIGLFGYNKKTRSQIIILDYVLKEVIKKYKEAVTKYAEQNEQHSRILFNKTDKIDTEPLINSYTRFLFELVTDKKVSIPTSKNISSKKLFDRALEAKPPFDSSDRGIRDTLIWLSIVDLINSNPEEYFCFITANTKDFGAEKLNKSLISDLGKNADKLIYFNSIESFLYVYGEQISFMDKSLFEKFFSKKHKEILSKIKIRKISHSSIEEIPRRYQIADIDDMSINNLDVEDFYVYSSTQSTYKVQVEISVVLELDIAVFDTSIEDNFTETENMKGYSVCWLEISLLVDKTTHQIEIDESISILVGYAL